ncbi:MAG: PDZ domain-containing protein [Bacillota bacterium]
MLKIAGAIAAELLDSFFSNHFFALLYILVILFIRAQYRKYLELQNDIYGKAPKSLREIIEQIILTGLLAGFAASFVTISAGLAIDAETVKYLFYIMCLLLLIDLRFVCISYAAGILALAGLILGIKKINIPPLLCLAGIMQLVESVLVYLSRKDSCVPVFIRHKDEIAGAYLIRRFWMIPVVFFTYMAQPLASSLDFAADLPAAFNISSVAGGAFAIGLDCLVAVLCYTDIAITRHPEKKSQRAAVMLFAYGAVLLMLAVLSVNNRWAVYLGTFFCLLGQELIGLYSQHVERNGVPLYNAVRRGLRILDVLPGSHAWLMGLERGDIILSINNRDIQTEEGVNEALKDFPTFTWINVLGCDGKEKTVEYKCFPGGYNTLGIIPVPRETEVTYNIGYIERVGILQNIVNKFRRIDRPT